MNQSVIADMEVSLPDGRRAVLRDNFTWEYVAGDAEGGNAADQLITLTIEKRMEGRKSCGLGLRLSNRAPYEIVHLVPRFSAITKEGIEFQSVYRSFQNVRPLREKYEEIEFADITCDDIDHVLVSGADHCAMGDLDRYSPLEGVCLARVKVVKSSYIDIRKQAPKPAE